MNKLKPGDLAIDIKGSDLNNNIVDLNNFKGKKVFVSFFRKASCPFCNIALNQLIQRHKEFTDQGIHVIALFASPKEEILKYAGKQKPPFPIIPDGQYKIYDKYGLDKSYVRMMKSMFNPIKVFKAMTGGYFSLKSTFQDPVLPGNFLIDENHVIHKAYYGKDYDDHLSLSEVIAWKG